jgi:hypothetical protein
MSEPQKSKRIKLPSNLSDNAKRRVGEKVIDFIKNRTLENIDINGKRFANYSESYSKSPEFILAGKSKTDPNLRLSGVMMEELDILEVGNSHITIGYVEGTDSNNKAVWAERSDNGPARTFLGILDNHLEPIIKEAIVEDKTNPTESYAQRLAKQILGIK